MRILSKNPRLSSQIYQNKEENKEDYWLNEIFSESKEAISNSVEEILVDNIMNNKYNKNQNQKRKLFPVLRNRKS